MTIELLNSYQQDAINRSDGPVLVNAGPGSGKTYVIARRMARIIEESADRHFKVLGLTFTNKAATEMRRRVEGIIPTAGERLNLTTFHSFGAQILRQHGSHIGISPNFSILSQRAERQVVLDEAIKNAGSTSAHYTSKQLLDLVTRMLDQNVQVDGAVIFLSNSRFEDAGYMESVYTHYRRLMVANNELDFGGVLAETLRLLDGKPEIQSLLRQIYPYVYVDEFHDTNLAQYELLRRLVNPTTRNIFAVADEDQLIYEWNGADPTRLKSFRTEFGANVLELPVSYRCPGRIVEAANRLIANNHEHNKMNLVAYRRSDDTGDVIRTRGFDTTEDESRWIADDITRRPVEARHHCVILARHRYILDPIIEALSARGIRCSLMMRKDEFTTAQMMWMHAMLRLANARQDREHLRKACRAFFIMEGVRLVVDDIVCASSLQEGDYLRGWLRAALQKDPSRHTARVLRTSVPKLAERLDFRSFVRDCFEWFDHVAGNLDNTREFHDEKKAWDDIVGDIDGALGRDTITLHALLHELGMRSKAAPVPEDAVRCYTIHGSKGLEFEHVYLAGLAEGILPDRRAIQRGDTSSEMREERRVCFVAITRVLKGLTLTYSRLAHGHTPGPSRFLAEMDQIDP